jgi:transposase-like protein
VRLLAIEIGASAATRKLGLSPNTVRSWAKRYNWNLPARAGRPAIVPATDLQRPSDILLQAHKALEETTKTALLQTVAKAAQLAAQKLALVVTTTAQLRDLVLTMARLCGLDGKPQTEVNIANQVGMVCDEATKMRLIKQREELLAKSVAPAAMTLPEPQAQLQTNIGVPNGILAANDPKPDSRPGSPWSMPAGAKAPSAQLNKNGTLLLAA